LRLRFLADRAKRTFRFLSPYYPVVREWTRKHAERWKRRYRALFPPDTATPEQAAARPGSPWRETVVLALDVVAFNVALYYFVRALLFAAAGIASGWTALAWAFGYAALVIALGWMPIAGRRQSPLQIKAFLNLGWAFAVILAMVSRVTVPSAMYQADFSWLVPEVIKTPLWAGMMASLSPIFVSAFVLAVLGGGGRRRWVGRDGRLPVDLLGHGPALRVLLLVRVRQSTVAGLHRGAGGLVPARLPRHALGASRVADRAELRGAAPFSLVD
jgi:hypothetical protein